MADNSTNSTFTSTEELPPPVKISVLTPLIYTFILLSIFITFSILYRRNRVKQLSKIEPIFGENHPKRIYEFLKQQVIDQPDNKPHEKVLKAALLRRSVEAVRRTMKLKENQPIFNKLYQDGLIGDDVYKQFEIEMKLQELEFREILTECETFKKGWVQTFIPLSHEICFNEALRRRLYSMDDRSESLIEMWEYFGEKLGGESEKKEVKPIEAATDEVSESTNEKSTAAKKKKATKSGKK
ncbi:Pre protein translocase subunit Sec66-domain-containing protein [Scheffersomyces coipomensis]|uniref:Pre protein translocase subunit Sec66-domain-containing protein n=1 Tax=Scheffersomyces coipomensis TaxID=1788519 RepID=UPI00315DCE82